jgi:hypothetical protein
MMPLWLIAGWRSRIETPTESAVRMLRMLKGLAGIHECFSEWYKKAQSRKAAFRPAWQMPPDIDELARLFEISKHRDLDGRITDTAFSAWNGREHETPISIKFFGNTESDNLLMPNSLTVKMSCRQESGPQLSTEDCKAALAVVAEAWDADFGSITPFGFDPPSAEVLPRPLLMADWMAYFSAELFEHFVPPAGAIVDTRPTGGRVVQTTEQRFDEDDPHHVAMADAMYRAMLASFGPQPEWGKMHEARARLGWE